MADEFPPTAYRIIQSQKVLVKYLQADLELCDTYLDLIDTAIALGYMRIAHRRFLNVQNACDTMARFLQDVEDVRSRVEISEKLILLRAALMEIKSRIQL